MLGQPPGRDVAITDRFLDRQFHSPALKLVLEPGRQLPDVGLAQRLTADVGQPGPGRADFFLEVAARTEQKK
jgi:hypothetical protein